MNTRQKASITVILSIIILSFLSCDQNQNKNGIDKKIIVEETSENLNELIRTNRKAFITKLTLNMNSDFTKAQSIINWLALNFDWKATDYKKRNVQQIIERRGGNCNDLAKVAINLMDSAKIRIRKVREINIHIESERRQQSAAALVEEKGFNYSVFGKMHNDHVWLEVYDQNSKDWLPADPSLGLIGLDNWMKGRVVFEDRKTLDPDSKDMIVPIAVFAQDENGNFTENRTEHYLIDSFDKVYDNKLSKLPSWLEWSKRIREIDDKCLSAFKGEENLHKYGPDIEAISNIYFSLRSEYQNKK